VPPDRHLAPALTWPHALAGPGGHGPSGTGRGQYLSPYGYRTADRRSRV